MSDLAELTVDLRGDACIVSIAGEIDISNAGELLSSIERAVPRAARRLVVDLAHARYLDSAGVGLLFTLADRLGARRQKVTIAVPRDAPVRAVLELMDLPSVVPLVPDVTSALDEDV